MNLGHCFNGKENISKYHHNNMELLYHTSVTLITSSLSYNIFDKLDAK